VTFPDEITFHPWSWITPDGVQQGYRRDDLWLGGACVNIRHAPPRPEQHGQCQTAAGQLRSAECATHIAKSAANEAAIRYRLLERGRNRRVAAGIRRVGIEMLAQIVEDRTAAYEMAAAAAVSLRAEFIALIVKTHPPGHPALDHAFAFGHADPIRRRCSVCEGKHAPGECVARAAERRAIPASVRRTVFVRDGRRCVMCGETGELVLDHVIPWSMGGSDEPRNLRVLCWWCNSSRGNRGVAWDDQQEARQKLATNTLASSNDEANATAPQIPSSRKTPESDTHNDRTTPITVPAVDHDRVPNMQGTLASTMSKITREHQA
jgi:hypothetical protein